MTRAITILLGIVCANAVWELALHLGEDPIKSMLICICGMITDVIYNVRNKG